MKPNPLKNIDGVRIRRQYFNGPIYVLFSIWVLIIVIFAIISFSDGNFSFYKWLDVICESAFTIAIFIIPWIILSVLNRFFFGKIVCVLSEEGIHHEGGLIKWNNISRIEYNIPTLNRYPLRLIAAHIDVVCKNETIKITSVPLYMFSVVKKSHPDIKTKMDKTVWGLVALTIFIIIIHMAVRFILK